MSCWIAPVPLPRYCLVFSYVLLQIIGINWACLHQLLFGQKLRKMEQGWNIFIALKFCNDIVFFGLVFMLCHVEFLLVHKDAEAWNICASHRMIRNWDALMTLQWQRRAVWYVGEIG